MWGDYYPIIWVYLYHSSERNWQYWYCVNIPILQLCRTMCAYCCENTRQCAHMEVMTTHIVDTWHNGGGDRDLLHWCIVTHSRSWLVVVQKQRRIAGSIEYHLVDGAWEKYTFCCNKLSCRRVISHIRSRLIITYIKPPFQCLGIQLRNQWALYTGYCFCCWCNQWTLALNVKGALQWLSYVTQGSLEHNYREDIGFGCWHSLLLNECRYKLLWKWMSVIQLKTN